MRDRVLEYSEKKAAIDQRIEDYLANHEDNRPDIETRMTSQSRTLQEQFECNSLSKLKETDDQEKIKSFEYLLKFTDNSLNYRGDSSRTRNRRPPRRRGGRQRGY